MSKIKKLLYALGGLFTVTGAALADGQITPAEGAAIGGAALAAVGVYFAKNSPKADQAVEDPTEPDVFAAGDAGI
jgi:hypothetical protein